MPGVIKQPDVIGFEFVPEVDDGFLHLTTVEIGTFDNIKPDFSQRRAHGARVIRGIAQWICADIFAVADDQSESFFLSGAGPLTGFGAFFVAAALRALLRLYEYLTLTT